MTHEEYVIVADIEKLSSQVSSGETRGRRETEQRPEQKTESNIEKDECNTPNSSQPVQSRPLKLKKEQQPFATKQQVQQGENCQLEVLSRCTCLWQMLFQDLDWTGWVEIGVR